MKKAERRNIIDRIFKLHKDNERMLLDVNTDAFRMLNLEINAIEEDKLTTILSPKPIDKKKDYQVIICNDGNIKIKIMHQVIASSDTNIQESIEITLFDSDFGQIDITTMTLNWTE